MNLPPPFRILLFVLGGGSLYAISTRLPRAYRLPLLIGFALLALILLTYVLVLKKLKKRKAKPLERGIADNAAATPQAVTDASRRAALEDLRKSFQKGIETFRAAGKNLYSLPWYLIVGEPVSGKTEAIRHSSIGFPPGLHEPLQGAGGTINMNWWFTNHAVVLDTAGRLMFEEIEHGAPSEWGEFLQLLNSRRVNCPINGMLLVIPTDSLIMDTADDIQRKGQKIAQQLDHIQRTLGVRFPVYVVITKCDLINGFREFFDNIDDPELQHQVLGWSNPAPLDEQFHPEVVDQHLQSVMERLERRRLGLLVDPVHTEDPDARRIDEVDALYAFQASLARIIPRLRRYLEMVFVAGEWSPKPLFLRGIYFTSSMREGSALDEELAEVLGVPVASLPEGRVWERERSYFLRDLFTEKVFREKGLVTRAAHVKRQHYQRRVTVLGAAFASVILFFFCALVWAGKLKRDIAVHQNHWDAAMIDWKKGNKKPYWRPIVSSVDSGYSYNRRISERIGKTLPQFHERTRNLLVYGRPEPKGKPKQGPPRYPKSSIFGWLVGRRSPRWKIVAVEEKLFRRSVLLPLVDTARKKMQEEAGRWSDEATNALAQLIRVQALWQAREAGEKSLENLPNLDHLFYYVLQQSREMPTSQDRKYLKRCLRWIYSEKGGEREWPARLLPRDGGYAEGNPIHRGVETFIEYWKSKVLESGDGLVKKLVVLSEALEEYKRVEGNFLAGKATPEGLTGAKQGLDGAIRDLGSNVENILKQAEGALDAAKTNARDLALYNTLLTEASTTSEGIVGRVYDRLETASTELEQQLHDVEARIKGSTSTASGLGLLRPVGSDRLYKYRYDICVLESATDIADQVEKIAEGEEPLTYPDIPPTAMRGKGAFEKKYHHKAATDYFAGWAAFNSEWGSVAQADRENLSARYNKLKGALGAYVGQYVTYWKPPAPGSTIVGDQWKGDFGIKAGKSWQKFQGGIVALSRYKELLGELQKLYGEPDKAFNENMKKYVELFSKENLAMFEQASGRLGIALKNLEFDRAETESERYPDTYKILKTWLDLPGEALAARQKLTNVADGKTLRTLYFPFEPTPTRPQDLDKWYWAELAYNALVALAQDPSLKEGVKGALTNLEQNYSEFPLVKVDPQASEVKQLTREQVIAARKLIEEELPQRGRETEAKVPKIDSDRIDTRLVSLWQPKMEPQDSKWVQALRDVLSHLPEKTETCSVSIEGQQFDWRFRHWKVEGHLGTNEWPQDGGFKLPYPNTRPVVFHFYLSPRDARQGEPYYSWSVRGEWGCLLMLHKRNWSFVRHPWDDGRRKSVSVSFDKVEVDGKTAKIELKIPYEDGESVKATIELRFDSEPPSELALRRSKVTE